MSKIYPYAGFWKRAVAFLIDSIVLSIPMTIITMGLLVPQGMAFAKLAASGTEPAPDVMMGMMGRYFATLALTWTIVMVGGWLYYALMESGKNQGTLGKMAMGIKVTGPHGERISFARATGRFFAKWISGMTLYFGFYMAGFTQKRQALHDIVATTLVIDKNYQETPQEIAEIPFSKGGCAAGIIAAVAPVIMYIGMVILVMVAGIAAGVSEAEHNNTSHQRPAAVSQQLDS